MVVQILLKRAASRKPYDVVVQDFAEGDFASLTDWVATRRHHNEADLADGKSLELLGGINRIRDDANVREALGNCAHDLAAWAVLEFNVDIAVSR